MVDPVTTSCGHTFDKKAIVLWYNKQDVCPVCNSQLADTYLHDDDVLRCEIATFLDDRQPSLSSRLRQRMIDYALRVQLLVDFRRDELEAWRYFQEVHVTQRVSSPYLVEKAELGQDLVTSLLSFGPTMNATEVGIADELRNRKDPPSGTWKSQSMRYDGARCYKVNGIAFDAEGLELTHVVPDVAYTVGEVTHAELQGLQNNCKVSDAIINAFSNYFHRNEMSEMENDPAYMPIHIMSTFFVSNLCFHNTQQVLPRPNTRAVDKWTSRKRACGLGGDDTHTHSKKSMVLVDGALDIFKCRWVVFPYNEMSNHWIVLCVNPRTLRMTWFDSLRSSIKEHGRPAVAQHIRTWLLHEHKRRHGKEHANATELWDPRISVTDGKTKGYRLQGEDDCGMHVCLLILLLQRKQCLNVSGSAREWSANAMTEVRRRLVLTFETGVYMFQKLQTIGV